MAPSLPPGRHLPVLCVLGALDRRKKILCSLESFLERGSRQMAAHVGDTRVFVRRDAAYVPAYRDGDARARLIFGVREVSADTAVPR